LLLADPVLTNDAVHCLQSGEQYLVERCRAISEACDLDSCLTPSCSTSFSTRRVETPEQTAGGDDRDEGLLGAAAVLQQPVRKIRALPHLGMASSMVPARVFRSQCR
jgi:hypothetical protein